MRKSFVNELDPIPSGQVKRGKAPLESWGHTTEISKTMFSVRGPLPMLHYTRMGINPEMQ